MKIKAGIGGLFLFTLFMLLPVAVMALIFSSGLDSSLTAVSVLLSTLVLTGCLFIFATGSFFKKRRAAPWFAGFALAHLAYAAAFCLRHPQLGAVVMLPAGALAPGAVIVAWLNVERRWAILLFSPFFLTLSALAGWLYWQDHSYSTGFSAYLFFFIGVSLFSAITVRLKRAPRLRAEGIAAVNGVPFALALILTGACGIACFHAALWLMLAGVGVLCCGLLELGKAWPRRRVNAVRSPEAFIAGRFSFPGGAFTGAVVRLTASPWSDDDEAGHWESERPAAIRCEGSLSRVDFAFEKPKLSFKPIEWRVALALIRPSGWPETYHFLIGPFKRKRKNHAC